MKQMALERECNLLLLYAKNATFEPLFISTEFCQNTAQNYYFWAGGMEAHALGTLEEEGTEIDLL